MNLLIIGPQASGKGTQAEKLAEKFNLAHLEMGSLFRKIEKEETTLGSKIKDYVEKGILVSDDLVIEVVNNYLEGIGRLDGIVFDGFPRVLSQAEYFEQFLKEKEKKIDLVIFLVLPREEVIKRLVNRRICEKCGKIYNLLTQPPRQQNHCDDCQGNLVLRSDETPEVITKRLSEYEEKTRPLIEFYRKRGILEEIDGHRSIEVIFEDIVARLEKRGLTNA